MILHTIDTQYKQGKYGAFYELTMVDERGDACVTYIDDSMDNYWHWANIVKQPDTGFILLNCKQKTKRGVPQFTKDGLAIIDADSLPEIELQVPIEDMRDEINNMLRDLDKQFQDGPDDEDPFEYMY